MPNQSDAFTLLMHSAAEGDRAAADALLPLVYQQLRAAAQQRLNAERPDHTLQATALVHEAYLRLVGPRDMPWANRAHFYAAAAEAMRRILIDHARTKARRGGSSVPLSRIRDIGDLALADSEKILAVDDAIRRLEGHDPDAAAVVRLRFFAGLSVDDTAEALSMSPRTVARLWSLARAVLFRELSDE